MNLEINEKYNNIDVAIGSLCQMIKLHLITLQTIIDYKKMKKSIIFIMQMK